MIKEISICIIIIVWFVYLLVIIVHSPRHLVHCTNLSTLHFHLPLPYFTTLSSRLVLSLLNFLPLRYTSHHHTSPYFTTLHFTFTLFSPHFYYLHFKPFIIPFLTFFLKMFGLHGKVPNTSAGYLVPDIYGSIYCTKEYFPISVLYFLCLICRIWWPYSGSNACATWRIKLSFQARSPL